MSKVFSDENYKIDPETTYVCGRRDLSLLLIRWVKGHPCDRKGTSSFHMFRECVSLQRAAQSWPSQRQERDVSATEPQLKQGTPKT